MIFNNLIKCLGGWGGIRTHETVSRLPVFKTGAFNHSATHPNRQFNRSDKSLRTSLSIVSFAAELIGRSYHQQQLTDKPADQMPANALIAIGIAAFS